MEGSSNMVLVLIRELGMGYKVGDHPHIRVVMILLREKLTLAEWLQ